MAALLAVPAPSRATLYDLEDTLACLTDSVETVEPDQERQFLDDFTAALTAAKSKRDNVGRFLAHLEGQISLADLEIRRLQERKSALAACLDKMKGYVVSVLTGLGKDSAGKWKKLEGETVTFGLRACPPSINVIDEEIVPAAHKTVTVVLPLAEWESLLDSLDLETNARLADVVKRAAVACSKTGIKAAIQTAVPDWKDRLRDDGRVFADSVPGAVLVAGDPSLVRS